MTNPQTTALDEGFALVSEHHKKWKARALQELRWISSARAKLPDKYAYIRDARFLFEDILPTLESLLGASIPHDNLAGAVAAEACRLGYIVQTGQWKCGKKESRHSGRSAEYRWPSHA